MRRFHRTPQRTRLWRKLAADSGASAIEYGLLAALIAIVILAAVSTVGTNLSGVFQSVANAVHS